MIRDGKILVYVLSGLAVGSGALAAADPAGHPFETIVERNVFGLRPPDPQRPPSEPLVPLPKITLTGITTILGSKRALLRVQAPARPGEPAKEESFMLAEGQRDADIEVLQINEAGGQVKVNHRGIPLTLDFVSNGLKPPTVPAQSPVSSPPTPTSTPPRPPMPQPPSPMPPVE